MNPDSVFSINGPDVIADSIDGETLIINLFDGVYYSADGVGDEIWRLLLEGHTIGATARSISEHYAGDAAEVRAAVLDFVGELLSYGLIVERDAAANGNGVTTGTGNGAAPRPFRAPVLQRYTDYQDLLLLDPIHEVAESSGWPVARAGHDTGT